LLLTTEWRRKSLSFCGSKNVGLYPNRSLSSTTCGI